MNSIHLTDSIESVYYEYQNEEEPMTPVNPLMTPISNRAVAGWDKHP